MAFQPASGLKAAPTSLYGKPVQQKAASDPFAPIDVHAWIRDNLGVVPAILTPEQARAQVQASLTPSVSRLTSQTNQWAQGGMAAVGGYANSLARGLAQQGPEDVHNTYAPAEAATAASNAALADRLSGAGNQAADDLAARLRSINEPAATDPAVAAIRQNATGAGNASYATGNASLDALIANHAAASEYSSKLPGLARLSGIQQAGQVEGEAAKALADQLGPLYAQAPGLVQGLLSANQSRIDNYNSRKDSAYLNLTGQNTTLALAKAATAAKAGVPDPAQSHLTGIIRDAYGNPVADATGHMQLVPGFHWDNNGNAVKDAKPAASPKDTSAADAKAAAKAKAAALKDARDTALSIVQDNLTRHTVYSTQPKVDQFGTVVKDTRTGKPLLQRTAVGDKASGSYYSAIHQIETAIKDELIAVGMTDYDVTRYAQTIANSYWKPGQGGRPGTG